MTNNPSELLFTGTEPSRAHATDAGYDMQSSQTAIIPAGTTRALLTGTSVAIPDGHVGLIAGRSSLALDGVDVFGGIVDSGFRGELRVVLHNAAHDKTLHVMKGDRIAQLLVIPVATPPTVEVDELPPADRGDAGFGSTGR